MFAYPKDGSNCIEFADFVGEYLGVRLLDHISITELSKSHAGQQFLDYTLPDFFEGSGLWSAGAVGQFQSFLQDYERAHGNGVLNTRRIQQLADAQPEILSLDGGRRHPQQIWRPKLDDLAPELIFQDEETAEEEPFYSDALEKFIPLDELPDASKFSDWELPTDTLDYWGAGEDGIDGQGENRPFGTPPTPQIRSQQPKTNLNGPSVNTTPQDRGPASPFAPEPVPNPVQRSSYQPLDDPSMTRSGTISSVPGGPSRPAQGFVGSPELPSVAAPLSLPQDAPEPPLFSDRGAADLPDLRTLDPDISPEQEAMMVDLLRQELLAQGQKTPMGPAKKPTGRQKRRV
ncbi:MAG: hypothetical protein ACPGOY_17310 [Rhodospirillaceae bacterium]